MALNIRTYRDLTEPDRSALVEQIGAQRRRVADRMAAVRHVVAVLSGVTQVFNPAWSLTPSHRPTVCRLEIGDTAGWKPALRLIGVLTCGRP